MCYRAKTREQAEAYFIGSNNAEVELNRLDEKHLDEIPYSEYDAYRAGYEEYRVFCFGGM